MDLSVTVILAIVAGILGVVAMVQGNYLLGTAVLLLAIALIV